MSPRIVCTLVVFTWYLTGLSQTDSLLSVKVDTQATLPQVEISDEPLRGKPVGAYVVTSNAGELEAFSNRDLGDLLREEGGVFVKSYGSGSIATTSMRGGNAGHTVLLWNGLPLQNPMLGLTDISLLPMSSFDELSISYGGQSTTWGSGAIGGVISLNNLIETDPGLNLSAGGVLGSFGLAEGSLKAAYGNGKWGGSTRFLYQKANNDFNYLIRPDLPERQQIHAFRRQGSIMQSLYWQPAAGHILSLQIWGQDTHREIPPTTVQNNSEAEQDDAFLRTALHWKLVREKVVWQAKAGLFREEIDFRDPLAGVNSPSQHWLASGEFSADWYLSPLIHLQAGISHQWIEAETGGYAGTVRQIRDAAFLLAKLDLGNWQLQGNFRQEIVDGKLQPFLPGLGIEGRPASWLDLRFRLSRNFRLPSLNDLYWVPGGNPNLLPESGWSFEGGFTAHSPGREKDWSYNLNGFSRHIHNWMLWSQQPGESFYSVNNITKVWSRGLENRISWTHQWNKWAIRLKAGYDFILSTNQVALERPQMDAGEQLPYTPDQQAFGSFKIGWRSLNLTYRHRYTGPVETLSSTVMPGYQLGFVSLDFTFHSKSWRYHFFADLDNVWNANYRIIEYRPMPGINGRLGVKLAFSSNNKIF